MKGSRELFKASHYALEGLLSLDSGRTWTESLPARSTPVVLDGALRVSDTASWHALSDGRQRNLVTDSLRTLASWTRINGRLWALGANGLFASLDSGGTWLPPRSRLPLDGAMTIRWHANALYGIRRIHESRSALLRSMDEGRSWTWLVDGLQSAQNFIPCAADLLVPVTLRIDTNDGFLRRDTLRILADGAIDTIGTSACPVDIRWDGIVFANARSTPPAGAGRIVKIPGSTSVASRAFVDGGIFVVLRQGDPLVGVAFVPDGGDSATVIMPLSGFNASLVESPAGALLASNRGAYRCTALHGCIPAYMPGTDSLWNTLGVVEMTGGVLFGIGYRHDTSFLPDYSRFLLHLSADTGKTWTTLDAPGTLGSAAVVPSGIVLSTDGAGLWHLDSDIFRVTGIAPRASRIAGPSLDFSGRFLSISGAAPGAHLRLADASGRILLDTRPELAGGAARIALPASPRGVLFASLASGGQTISGKWVRTRP